jgi:RimJ/RimL family protein N-acetyltransferase
MPAPPAQPVPKPVTLHGRHTVLRPITEYDYEFLFDLATSEEVGYRWRFRGETPSPQVFVQRLWHNVLAQFVVCRGSDAEPVGHILAYNADLPNGHAYLAMAVRPETLGRGWTLEAVGLFIEYVFRLWDFQKLYAYSAGFSLASFNRAAGLIREEGRLIEHEYFDGKYWDMHIFAIHREDWESLVNRHKVPSVPR